MFFCFCGNAVDPAFVYCPPCGKKKGDAKSARTGTVCAVIANMESVRPKSGKRKEPSVSDHQSFSSFMK